MNSIYIIGKPIFLDDDGNASIGETENQSERDEASSGSPSIERLGGAMSLGLGGGGRKRKSRNPTRINLANMLEEEEPKIKSASDNRGNFLHVCCIIELLHMTIDNTSGLI